jgi:hypothetical protein
MPLAQNVHFTGQPTCELTHGNHDCFRVGGFAGDVIPFEQEFLRAIFAGLMPNGLGAGERDTRRQAFSIELREVGHFLRLPDCFLINPLPHLLRAEPRPSPLSDAIVELRRQEAEKLFTWSGAYFRRRGDRRISGNHGQRLGHKGFYANQTAPVAPIVSLS